MPTRLMEADPDDENGVYYPCSDGKPMAETDFHIYTIRLLLDALDDYFAARPDAYVTGNVNWYWEEGNNKAKRAPDAFVAFGVPKKRRRSFRSWNEGGVVPAVCFEVASKGTWRRNLGPVKDDYEANGVQEYFVFDTTGDYLKPERLVGFRRRGDRFLRIRPDKYGALISRQLGLCLVPEGEMLRLVRIDNGARIPTREERVKAEQIRMAEQIARGMAAIARTDTLELELERMRNLLRSTGKLPNGAH